MTQDDVRVAAMELVRDFHVPHAECYAMVQAICRVAQAHGKHEKGKK